MEFGSTTVAAIYKDRWEIELFFKALNPHFSQVLGKRPSFMA
jgi:IS4 transposase